MFMNFYADSNYIHARICALHSLLLARKDYNIIVEKGNFSSIIAGSGNHNIKNEYTFIKEKIFENQVDVIIRLMESSASSYEIFILFLRFFEMLNLKLICSGIFNRAALPSIWYNIGDYAVLKRSMAAQFTSIDMIINSIKDTWMCDLLIPDTGTFEDIEFSIDRNIIINVLKTVQYIDFRYRSDFIKIVSCLAAFFDLTWTMRLKKNYDWSPEQIRDYINLNLLMKDNGEVMGRSVENWKRILLRKYSVFNRDISPQESDNINFDQIIERILRQTINKMFHENFHSINTITCYLYLLYRQIKNLFSIVDGLRFDLPAEIIMNYIICEG